MDKITCAHCKGEGKTFHAAFVAPSGRRYNARYDVCYKCDAPDVKAIVAVIFSKRKEGALVSRRPKEDRPYYVWRMVRFHTGADVTLPMAASLGVSGDPYKDQLDAIAELIAQKMTGRSSSGRARWRSALRGEEPEAGLAASAYPGGPVILDSDKPQSEQLELF